MNIYCPLKFMNFNVQSLLIKLNLIKVPSYFIKNSRKPE